MVELINRNKMIDMLLCSQWDSCTTDQLIAVIDVLEGRGTDRIREQRDIAFKALEAIEDYGNGASAEMAVEALLAIQRVREVSHD